MMHRGTPSRKSHLVADRIFPSRSWPRSIAVCGEYNVTAALPAYVAFDFVCRKCVAKVGKSIERMVRS